MQGWIADVLVAVGISRKPQGHAYVNLPIYLHHDAIRIYLVNLGSRSRSEVCDETLRP